MHPEIYQVVIDFLSASGFMDGREIKLLYDIPTMSIEQRSALIKFSRASMGVSCPSVLYSQISILDDYMLETLFCYMTTTVKRAFLLLCARNGPMSKDQAGQMLRDSLGKEVLATQKRRKGLFLNFRPFFGRYKETVHESIKPNPPMAEAVHVAIERWLLSLTEKDKVHYPTISHKFLSKDTWENATKQQYMLTLGENMSSVDAEVIYMKYGVEVQGNCELRQKFYPAQFKPRTYFAPGGFAFSMTKYVPSVVDDLVRYFEPCNVYSRVNPHRLRMDPGDYVRFYDLASFTSTLECHQQFLEALAEHAGQTVVKIYDAVVGETTCLLSTILEKLADLHCGPGYNVTIDDEKYELRHETAGFLGVFGNISTATFLHAAIMAQSVQDIYRLNIAGDDGAVVSNIYIDKRIDDTTALVGYLAKDKIYPSTEPGLHLKRGIVQIGLHLVTEELLILPTFEFIYKKTDLRYPYIHQCTKKECRESAAASIMPYAKTLRIFSLDQEESRFMRCFTEWYYQLMQLPTEGFVPQIEGAHGPFVPSVDAIFQKAMDPIEYTIKMKYRGLAVVPRRGDMKFDKKEYEEEGTVISNSCPFLAYSVKLGLIQQENLSELVFGEIGRQRLIDEYRSDEFRVYKYTRIDP